MEKSNNRDVPNRRPVYESAASANTCIDGMVQESPPCAACHQEPAELPTDCELITEWSIIREDPSLLISLVDQFVTVHMRDSNTVTGFVHCIDRRDLNIIINVPVEGIYHPQYIPDFMINHVVRSRAPSYLVPPVNMTPSPPSWSSSDEEESEQARRPPGRLRPATPHFSVNEASQPARLSAHSHTEVLDTIAEDIPPATRVHQSNEDCDLFFAD